jgi:PiT family inorganic phosphate transporter
MDTFIVLALILSVFYGIVIGQNDAANSFGAWIGSRVGKVRTGLILCGASALAGAFFEGGKVIKTIGGGIVPASYLTHEIAVIGIIASILWVFLASNWGLPISTTHSAVGGIGGIGAALILFGKMPASSMNLLVVRNIIICWLTTPIGSMILAFIIARIVLRLIVYFPSERKVNQVSKILLTISSSYVAYTWGANDVANSVALLVGSHIMTVHAACILGGVTIAIGAILLGHKVAETLGFGITDLTPLLSVCADISTAITIHFFTEFKIPVSTTHAIVGSIVGVGLARGVNIVNFKMIRDIVFAWGLTPILTFSITFIVYVVFTTATRFF